MPKQQKYSFRDDWEELNHEAIGDPAFRGWIPRDEIRIASSPNLIQVYRPKGG